MTSPSGILSDVHAPDRLDPEAGDLLFSDLGFTAECK